MCVIIIYYYIPFHVIQKRMNILKMEAVLILFIFNNLLIHMLSLYWVTPFTY